MANTQMERCPRCRSTDKKLGLWNEKAERGCLPGMTDPWHSTPAAPETARLKEICDELMKRPAHTHQAAVFTTNCPACESETPWKEES